jgi:hypothetical protein
MGVVQATAREPRLGEQLPPEYGPGRTARHGTCVNMTFAIDVMFGRGSRSSNTSVVLGLFVLVRLAFVGVVGCGKVAIRPGQGL